jgi:hypothetical protein
MDLNGSKISPAKRKRAAALWDPKRVSDPESYLNGYSDEAQALKDEAHRLAKALLKDLAENILKLPKSAYEIRSNKAGVAISGEVTLHTDPLPNCQRGVYVQIGQMAGHAFPVLYRSCKDRKDYVGGANNFAAVGEMFSADPSKRREFLEKLHNYARLGM